MMQRFVLPFLISAILHLLILSGLNWNGLHAKPGEPYRLAVSLVPVFAFEDRVRNLQTDHGSAQLPLVKTYESTDVLEANASNYSLDMSRIRD
jgi:hypothetical protein